jgi:Uma2 family endonuclease
MKIIPHYTYEDYCLWEGRWELIEGIPFAKSPAPSPRHQWLIANIISELRTTIKKSTCRHCKVYDFIDVKIEEDTILQQDCSVVCQPIHKNFLDFAPALVVEILSHATALKDRHSKFSWYEKFGIAYYMIVDEGKEVIEIYQLNDKKYELTSHSPASPFTFTFDDDCKIDFLAKNIWE